MQGQRIFKRVARSLIHQFFWFANYYLRPHVPGDFNVINRRISELPLITRNRHLFGSVEWRYNGKPIGHMHGNRTVDILFHPNIQSIILSEGRAEKNNYVGNGISVQIRRAGDVGYAFELLLKSYHLRKQTTANEYNQQSVISI
jgi:hypothetical protein